MHNWFLDWLTLKHEHRNVPRFTINGIGCLNWNFHCPLVALFLPDVMADKVIKQRQKQKIFKQSQIFLFYHSLEQNKSKEITSSKGHSSATATKSDAEQTSISLSNDTESIKKQEPKKQVNIVISYIEKNDEQGIGQLVKIDKMILIL